MSRGHSGYFGRRVRVAYITHYGELLGANRSLLDLMLQLRERGVVDPLVILPRTGALSERLQEEGVPFQVFPFVPWMSERHYMGGPHHRLGQWLRYERAARERRRTNDALLPVIAGSLRQRDVQLLHANSAAVSVADGLKAATGLPLVWHVRELPERQYLLHIDRGRRAFGRALLKADALIAISQAVCADVLRYAPRVRPRLVYNGVVRRSRYEELRAHASSRWEHPSPFTFVLVGLIHASKGQEEAIEAIDIVRRVRPDVKLVIAGSGKDAHLRTLIHRLHLHGHVDLRGYVPDPFTVFHGAHVCLMCSRNEAMGRVTVEAMAAGLAVIGHDSGGTPELVTNGANGLLYTGGAQDLAERMLQMANAPALARSLGERAMVMAAERFSIEGMGEEVRRIYEEVMRV